MAKVPPMELEFWLVPPEGGGPLYVDIAQCLSLINRKSLRQGYQYAIQNIELVSIDPASDALLTISRLPNHWPFVNAWVKAFSVWRKSQDQVLELDNSIQARYADFKVFMNSLHVAATMGNNAIPLDYITDWTPTDPTAQYEWEESHIQIPNDPTPGVTTQYSFTALDDDTVVSKGLVHGYAESRARPQSNDPNLVSGVDSWMVEAFDVGDNLPDIRDDIIYENDSPPYPVGRDSAFEFYPGGQYQGDALQLQDYLSVRSGTSLRSDSSGPFVANLGLLFIDCHTATFDNSIIKITVMPGKYKGVGARPMQDVN